MRVCVCFVLMLFVISVLPLHAAEGTTAEAAGITVRTLSDQDLDDIKTATGYRLGVEVVEVKAGTPGADAGYKAGDLIFGVGNTGVDSAEKFAAAIGAATGELDLPSAIRAGDTFEAQVVKLKLEGGAAAAEDEGQGGLGGLGNGGAFGQGEGEDDGPANANADPISAYFDMMDFVRSQAWGRKVVTPADERQRVAVLMQQSFAEMDAQSQAQIMAIPEGWAQLQAQWKGASEAEKTKLKSQWADALISPGNMYPAPEDPQQFAAEGNVVGFGYPGDWTGGLTEIDGTPFLFIGPGGSQASWDKVFDTPNSPPGALFAIADIPAGAENATFVDGARYLAQLLIPNGLQNFREVQVLPIGEVGAVITIAGKFPGQNEERFYWIGCTAFGQGKIFAGRMGGKVSEAERLIPAFTYVLNTLQLNPPAPAGGGGGGGASGAWEAAWSRVGTAAVSHIWAPSGN